MKLQNFLDNLKEKKTSIIGGLTAAIALLALFAPHWFREVTAGEVTEVAKTGLELIIELVTLISGIALMFSRMRPKE